MYSIELLRYNYGQGSDETIYDQSQMNSYSAIGPKCNQELNEGGSLQFTLSPDHSLYDVLEPLSSFVRLLDDEDEIFFGRILQRSEPTLTGLVTFQCEGAISFLLDSEIAPYGKDSDGNQITRDMTAEAFFIECINAHNSDIGNDPRRSFTVGIVNVEKKNVTATYSITNYSQTKGVIESQLLDVYGGFLRVRPGENGLHYIDWIENYETVDPQEIIIGENLESQTNEIDGSTLFTVLRPIGKDGLTLDPATMNVYSAADIAKYGRIVKTIHFEAADTTAKLQTEAQDYVTRMQKTMFATSNIQLVDMHYLDGTTPKIRLGDRFTNIHGMEDEELVASSLSLDLERPQNDMLDLKNRKSLDPDLTPEGNAHKNSSSLTKKNLSSKKTQQGQYFKYIKEQGDTLEILADKVNMHGDLLEQHYNKILTTAGYYERISSRVDNAEGVILDQKKKVNDVEYNIRTIEGTAVIQNSQTISNLAGKFEIWEDQQTGKVTLHLVDGAEIAVDSVNGGTITVGQRIGQLANDYNGVKTITDSVSGSALWTQREKITGVVGEYDIVYTEIPDPDHEGETLTVKTLVLNSGGGMRIRKDNVDYGIYMTPNAAYKSFTPRANENPKESGLYEKVGDSYVRTNDTTAVSGKQYYYRDPNVDAVLTGGLMVEEINRQTRTKILGDRVDIEAKDVKIRAQQSLDTVVGHFEEKWIWDVDDQGNRVKRYYLEYVADAGMIVKRLDDEGIMTEYGVWDDGNLTGGVMVQLINGQAEVHIKGSKVFVGDGAENVEENLANWSSDTDENYSLVTRNLAAERARINEIVADYVTASSLYSTVGGIKYITGQAISVTGSVTGKNIYADNGDIYIREISNQGVPGAQAQMSQAVSSAHITLTDNTYTLHLYDMFGNELTAPQGKVMTFSRATALSGAFGSGENLGTLTITARPQGNEYKVYFPKSEPNTLTNAILISDTDNNAITYAISEDSGDKNNVYLKTIGVVNGSAQTVKVAKYSHNQYRAGWEAAYGDVDIPSQTANGQSMHVEWPSMTQDGTVNTRDYTLYTMTNNKVGVRYWSGSSYITVAEYSHNKYQAGWEAAYGDVDIPSQTANGQSMHVEWPSMTQDGTVNTRDYTLYTMTNNKVGVRYWSGSSYITVAEYSHNKYDAGWTAAHGFVDAPASGSSASFVMKAPRATPGSTTAADYTFTMSNKNDNTVQCKYGSIVVAEYPHNKYNAGWTAAHGFVDAPASGSSASFVMKAPRATPGSTTAADYTFTMSNKNDNTVQCKYGSIVVAEFPHNKYTAGGTDAGVTGVWVGNKYTATRAANTATKSVEVTVDINPSTAQSLDPGGSVTIYARGNSDNKASVTVSAKSVTAGASQPVWDSTNKNFYTYGYAYKSGSSAAIATSAKQTSGTVTIDTGSWSNGSRTITVKCGNTTMFNPSVSAPTDSNLTAGNIKSGVTIFGVTGSYSAGSVTDITMWTGNYQWTGNVDITGSHAITPYCKLDGVWKAGTPVTLNAKVAASDVAIWTLSGNTWTKRTSDINVGINGSVTLYPFAGSVQGTAITIHGSHSGSSELHFTESKTIGSTTYFYYWTTTGIFADVNATKWVYW